MEAAGCTSPLCSALWRGGLHTQYLSIRLPSPSFWLCPGREGVTGLAWAKGTPLRQREQVKCVLFLSLPEVPSPLRLKVMFLTVPDCGWLLGLGRMAEL